eukprot:8708364-Pyramimonas_sp.AAC.1
MPNVPSMASFMASTNTKTGGSNWNVEERFAQLRADLQELMEGSRGPLLSVMGVGNALPDGSAIYDVLFHRSGVVINGF